MTLSSISPNLSKHRGFLAFWLSLCFGSILLFLVCHDTAFLFSMRAYDRAWLTSKSSQRYDNLGTVKIEGIPITLRLDMNTLSALYTAGGTRALLTILALPLSKTSKKDSGAKPKFTKKLTVFTSVVNLFTTR